MDIPSTKKKPSTLLERYNSGSYHPGPINENGQPTAELSVVQAHDLDLQHEEFPEGPYGAATNETKLGKTSLWKPGQRFVSRYRDQNPIGSDRKVPLGEEDMLPSADSLDQQN